MQLRTIATLLSCAAACFIRPDLFKMAATSSRQAGLLSALNFYLVVALALYGTATLI